MMLLAALVAAAVQRLRQRRDPLVEVWRDRCVLCGYTEDGPDREGVLIRMGRHIVREHDPVWELL